MELYMLLEKKPNYAQIDTKLCYERVHSADMKKGTICHFQMIIV